MKPIIKDKNGKQISLDLTAEQDKRALNSGVIVIWDQVNDVMRFFRYAGEMKDMISNCPLFEEVDGLFII